MTTNKSNAAPDPRPEKRADASVVEQIARQWDGCQYDAPGEMVDIGAAIRGAGKRLSAELAEQRWGAHVLVLREMRARLTDAGSPSRTAALDAAIAALVPRQLGAQEPVGEVYQGSARLPQARLSKPLPIGSLLYAAPPAQGIDLGKLWEQAHAAMLNQRKRNKHDCFVLRCLKEDVKKLIDGQRDAAPGVES